MATVKTVSLLSERIPCGFLLFMMIVIQHKIIIIFFCTKKTTLHDDYVRNAPLLMLYMRARNDFDKQNSIAIINLKTARCIRHSMIPHQQPSSANILQMALQLLNSYANFFIGSLAICVQLPHSVDSRLFVSFTVMLFGGRSIIVVWHICGCND